MVLCRVFRLVPLVVLVFVALAGSGFTSPASAQGTTVDKSVQINALADANWCETGSAGETCYEAHLDVAEPSKSFDTGVCLQLTGFGPGGESFEEGCADAAGKLALNPKDLSTASLSPVSIDLNALVCDPETNECDIVFSRTVTVEAAWVGAGKSEKVIGRFADPQNNCLTNEKIIGLIQNATATIGLDGAGHEATGNLQVLDVQDRTFCR
jgi:hypothetical protein